jgi:hypothetical protein
MFPTWWKPRKPQAARLRQLDLSSTHGLLTEMLDKAATRNEILSEPDGTLGAPLQAVLDFCNSDLGSLHLLVREAYKEKGVQVTGKKPDTWISARVPVHKAEAPVVAATEADEVTSNASEYQEEPSIVVSFAELLCPITQELFVDPVVAADGFTYERGALLAWFARCGDGIVASPLTNAPLSSMAIVDNQMARSLAKKAALV